MRLRKQLFIYVVAILALTASGFSQTNISKNSSDSHRGSIAVNQQGVVLIVWCEGVAGEESGNLWYSYLKSGQWSTPKNTQLTRRTAWSPHLDVDSNGNFHLAWADGFTRLDREIYYAMFDPNTGNWGAWQEIHNSPENSAWERIAVDQKNDTIYIAWFHEHVDPWVSDITSKNKVVGGSWPSAYERIGFHPYDESTHPALDVLDSRIHIVYMEGHGLYAPWRIRYKEGNTGRQWEGYEPSTLTENGYYPDMQVDDDSDSHVVWASREGHIFYRGQIFDTWGNSRVISSGFCDLQFPGAHMSNGYGAFCWTQHGSGGVNVFYRILETGVPAGDKWGEVKKASPNAHHAEYPQIWIDNSGYAHVMWDDTAGGHGGVRDIFYEKIYVYTPPATIQLSANVLNYTIEGLNPEPEEITISNIGSEGYTYTAESDVDWITLSKTSGELAPEEEETIILTSTAATLDIGQHRGTVTFTSPEARNSPQTITVNMNVLEPPILEPENFAVEAVANRALFYVENVHRLTWQANDQNHNIVGYLVYRDDGLNHLLLAELDDDVFEYLARGVNMNTAYTYEVAAKDSKGRIGVPAKATVGGTSVPTAPREKDVVIK